MNKPPKGNTLRVNNAPQMMLQVKSLNDSSNPMRVRITEGSFWLNNSDFIEVVEQNSPIIEAPINGVKWVLVYVDGSGIIKLSNGQATTKSNPPQPVINKNCLPLAFIFVTSNTTQITQDIIYPCHNFMMAGGYPQQHNELQGRNDDNSHTISAITGLQDALDSCITKTEADYIFTNKADVDGTINNFFTLNKNFSGVPINNCGIVVNRGNELSAGIRFSEESKTWQYSNDNVIWHNFDNDTDYYDRATDESLGMVKLSVPVNNNEPIAVSDNDPRIASIENKANRSELSNYFSKTEVQNLIDTKVSISDVYTKHDAEQTFVSKAEYNASGQSGYSKNELNDLLSLKANSVTTYTKTEIEDKFKNYFTKQEIDEALAKVATGEVNVYTSTEIDAMMTELYNKICLRDEIDKRTQEIWDNITLLWEQKPQLEDVYTKLEIDTRLASIGTTTQPSVDEEGNPIVPTINLSSVYSKVEVNDLLGAKAEAIHNHVASDIVQDSTHRMVSDSDIDNWNKKQNELTFMPENVANKGLANGYASLDAEGRIPVSQMPRNLGIGENSIGADGIEIINTYTELQAITEPNERKIYLVKDASDDIKVMSGAAQYIYNDLSWILIATMSDVEFVLDWNNVQNKPTVFAPDTSYLTNYVKLSDVYTKTDIDDRLDNKAEAQHTHDSTYLRLENYNTFKLGNYLVDESAIGNGKVLTFDEENQKLVFANIETENGSANKLGDYNIIEPADLKGNYSLIFDGSSLTYKDMRGFVGTTEIDETDMAENKALVYDGTKLVYKPMTADLNVDIENRKDGYVLAYNEEKDTLEYVAPAKETSINQIYTYTVETISGRKCMVRANMPNAITYEVDGSNITITKKAEAEIYMLQLFVKSIDHNGTAINPATLTVNMVTDDNVIPDYNTYEGIMPTVSYYAMDSTRKMMTNNIVFDMEAMGDSNPLRMKITNIATYNYIVKILF